MPLSSLGGGLVEGQVYLWPAINANTTAAATNPNVAVITSP